MAWFSRASTITVKAAENPASSEIISRFQEYMRINTANPNPNYYEAVDFILTQAISLSLESQVIEFVKSKPSILLNSHTDFVPVECHKWTHPPFAANIDSHGNIYARGSQMKRSEDMMGPKCLIHEKMNVAVALDEGIPSANDKCRAYYAEGSLIWLVIKTIGAPGRGA